MVYSNVVADVRRKGDKPLGITSRSADSKGGVRYHLLTVEMSS